MPLLCCRWARRLSEFTCHCLDSSAHAHGRAAPEQPCSLHPQPPTQAALTRSPSPSHPNLVPTLIDWLAFLLVTRVNLSPVPHLLYL